MLRINVVVLVLVLALSWQVTNSRTSTLWKINKDCGKITGHDVVDFDGDMPLGFNSEIHDDVFYIIASTIIDGGGGSWIRHSSTATTMPTKAAKAESNEMMMPPTKEKNKNNNNATMDAAPRVAELKSSYEGNNNNNATTMVMGGSSDNNSAQIETALVTEETLNCGKPVNFTYYDYLIGVGQRFNHPLVPEPEVAYLFLKNKDESTYKNFDITALEKRLKRAKRNKPRSVQLYNQIGNYWRIVGDARQAIECFRRALAMSPTNADVLLNLARVLYNLQYLDDAIHLTRRSLEMQPPGRSAWQQYFTLGEIFKAYGHFQESILHLRHALELYPHHEPILKALRDVENSPSSTLHMYTVVIIIALVVAVFVVICNASGGHSNGHHSSSSSSSANASASSSSTSSNEYEPKTQRHFNRAMAMRSLKGLQSSRNYRHRKY